MNFRKSDYRWLEKIFACEIEGRLFQSKAKRLAELERMGYCRKQTRHLPADRFGPIAVSGYVLTILGNFTYCMSCDGAEEELTT